MGDAAQELKNKTNKQQKPSQTKVVMERDGPSPAGAVPHCAGVSKEAPAHLSSQREPCSCSMYWLQALASDSAAPSSPSTAQQGVQTALEVSPCRNSFLLWPYPHSWLPGAPSQTTEPPLDGSSSGVLGAPQQNPSEGSQHPYTTSSFQSKGWQG